MPHINLHPVRAARAPKIDGAARQPHADAAILQCAMSKYAALVLVSPMRNAMLGGVGSKTAELDPSERSGRAALVLQS